MQGVCEGGVGRRGGGGGGLLLNYKGLHGQGKLINAEINKLFWPPEFLCSFRRSSQSNLLSAAAAAVAAATPGFQTLNSSLALFYLVSKDKSATRRERDNLLSQITGNRLRLKLCRSSAIT